MAFCLTKLYLCALSLPQIQPFIEITLDGTYINSAYAISSASTSRPAWNFNHCIQIPTDRSSQISPLTAYAENATTSFLSVEFGQTNPIDIQNNGNFTRHYSDTEPAVNYMAGRNESCTESVKYTVTGISTSSVQTSTTDPIPALTSNPISAVFCLIKLSLCAVSTPPVLPFIEISIDGTYHTAYAILPTFEGTYIWDFDYCVQIERFSEISPLTAYAESENATISFLYVEFSQNNAITVDNDGDFTKYRDDSIEPNVYYRNGRISECIEWINYTITGIHASVTDTDIGIDQCKGIIDGNTNPFIVVEKICRFCFESSGSNEESCLSLSDSGRVGWFLERQDCFMLYCELDCEFDKVTFADGVALDNLEGKCSEGCDLFTCPVYNTGETSSNSIGLLIVMEFLIMMLLFTKQGT